MKNQEEVKMNNEWRIVESNMGNGKIEYQVSDGDVGERSLSYDFDNLPDAKTTLELINFRLELEELRE